MKTDIFHQAFDSSRMGMIVVDGDWKMVEVNDAFCKMLGFQKEELVGRSIIEITHLDDRAVSVDKNNKLFTGTLSSFQLEKRYLTKSGEAIWVSINPSVLEKDESGKPTLAFSTVEDISKRKKLELALKESESNYHTMIEMAPDAVAVHSGGKVIFVNRAGVKLLGATRPEDIIGKPTLSFVHPDSLAVVVERIKKMAETGEMASLLEEKFLRLDGTPIDVEVVARPIVYEGKKAVQVVIHDISESKRIRDEIKKSESRYRILAEAAHDMIFVLDRTGTITYANSFAAAQFGIKPEQMVGKKRSDFFGASAETQDISLKKVFETGEPFYRETRYPFGEKMIWLSTWLVPLKKDGEVTGILGVSRDISSQKAAELELMRLNRTLKESEGSYKGLFDSVSEAIYIQDTNGKFLDVNPGAEKMYGYPREWFIGKSPLDVSAPGKNDLPKIKEAVDRAFAGEPQEFEFWGMRKSGEAFPKDVRLYKGTYFGKDVVIALATDITARKKTEDVLRESEERFRSLFTNMLDGFAHCEMIFDEKNVPVDFIYLDVNDRFTELTGLRDVVGKKVSEVIPGLRESNPELFEIYGRAATTGEPGRFETYVPQLSIWFSISVYSPQKGHFVAVFSNVTDKKRAEEELKNSEEKYRNLIDNMSEGLGVQDKNGLITFMNKRGCEMLGYGLEELIGKPTMMVFDEENQKILREQMALRRKGEHQNYEISWLRKDGGKIDTIISPGPRFDDQGNLVESIAVFTDITDRKKAEAELAKSNLQLRSVYDQTSDILYYMAVEGDGSYRFTSVNPSFYKATGLKQNQVIGKLVTEVIPEPSLSLVLGKYKAAIEEKKLIAWEEITPYPTGTKYGDVSVAPIFDDKGRCTNLIGTVHDITDRKKAEEEVMKANRAVGEALRITGSEKAKLEVVLNGIADGVFVVDDHGRIILFNRAAEKISGLSFETIKGRQYWEVLNFVPEGLSETKVDFIRSALSGKEKEVEVNLSFKKASGKIIPVQASAATLAGGGKQSLGIVVIFRDVSREREVQQLRDEFMMIASHELRAPMTAIRWSISMMLEGSYGALSENLRKPLSGIASSADRLIHLVNDMINITRIEAGNLRLSLSNFDIKKMIDDLLITFGSEAKEKNIQIDISGIESVMVQADVDWTAQILSNLIDNALKFNREGGKVTISGRKEDEYLHVVLADTGVGIPEDFREKLFTKFSQVLSVKEGKSVGTGLGLYISRELAHNVGGDLWLASSKTNEGSTFVFKIPLSGSPAAGITLANHKNKVG